MQMIIDIAIDFSPKPFGRDDEDGKFSGKRFREDKLMNAFNQTNDIVTVYLDGVSRGYGSSFLEESFAGLLRYGIDYETVKNRLKIDTSDIGYKNEIWSYIEEQHSRDLASE